MGFFKSSSTQEQTNTYSNPTLESYTAPYRATAPWTFATLDPTATLASYRKNAGKNSQSWDAEGRYIGPKAFRKELQAQADAEKLSRDTANAALTRIQKRQESGQFLTSQETEFINQSLDQAFQYAHDVGFRDWQLGAQSLAGSRGLRTSDTPVAAPAMAELRNFEIGLGSKRAEMGLNATMQLSAQQNAFDQSLNEFQNQLMQSKWATRQGFMFGGGLQGAGNIGYTNKQVNTQTNNMSTFQKVMAGFQMASAAQAFGTNAMSMGLAGTPSSNVGGSEYGGSKGWGEGFGSAAGGASALMGASDRRLKSNIVRIGTHKLGIGIYEYDIADRHEIGVMADEVRQVKPQAVVRYADGYDRVNYSML